jgi:hypothetical protein
LGLNSRSPSCHQQTKFPQMEIRVKDVGDTRQKIKQSRNQGMEAEVDLYPMSNATTAAVQTAQARGRKFKTTSGGLRQDRSRLERFFKGPGACRADQQLQRHVNRRRTVPTDPSTVVSICISALGSDIKCSASASAHRSGTSFASNCHKWTGST